MVLGPTADASSLTKLCVRGGGEKSGDRTPATSGRDDDQPDRVSAWIMCRADAANRLTFTRSPRWTVATYCNCS